MNATQEKAIAKLREQQSKAKEHSPAWGVAEQLIDICSAEPAAAEILLLDLDNPDMDISHAEKKIHDLADEYHKKFRGSCVCVTLKEAEGVLREFYGLPSTPEAPYPRYGFTVTPTDHISLADFL